MPPHAPLAVVDQRGRDEIEIGIVLHREVRPLGRKRAACSAGPAHRCPVIRPLGRAHDDRQREAPVFAIATGLAFQLFAPLRLALVGGGERSADVPDDRASRSGTKPVSAAFPSERSGWPLWSVLEPIWSCMEIRMLR